MTRRTSLARARGLGSAKDGTAHWWAQRVTAVALVPLTLWFVASVAAMTGAEYGIVIEWLRSPLVTVLMLLLIVMTFHHAQLGLQVVIEDYVHREGVKIAAIILVKFAAALLGLASALAVLRIAVGT